MTEEQCAALKEALRVRGYEAEVTPSKRFAGFDLSFGEGAAMAANPDGDDPTAWAESIIDFIERSRDSAEKAGLCINLPPRPAPRPVN